LKALKTVKDAGTCGGDTVKLAVVEQLPVVIVTLVVPACKPAAVALFTEVKFAGLGLHMTV
jgi:hypothetical protein